MQTRARNEMLLFMNARLTSGRAGRMIIVALMSAAVLVRAESPTHTILHHFFTHFVDEWTKTHKEEPVPTMLSLTPAQRAAIERLAATIDQTLPAAEQDKAERKLAHEAATAARVDPKRPIVLSGRTPEQRAALRQFVAALQADRPNESAPSR
ncbi:MAG: hypothetical protein ACR2HH_06935 [Chthoniobacterales bacterium]